MKGYTLAQIYKNFVMMLQRRINVVIITISMVLWASSALTVSKSADAVKAAFILNFSSFVEWPIEVGLSEDVVKICILDEEDLVVTYLRQLIKGTTEDGMIEIEHKGRDSSLKGCHILYISSYRKSDVDYMIGKSAKEPILTISGAKDFVKRGGAFGFVMKEGEVTLEANTKVIGKAKLIVDSELLELMKIHQ